MEACLPKYRQTFSYQYERFKVYKNEVVENASRSLQEKTVWATTDQISGFLSKAVVKLFSIVDSTLLFSPTTCSFLFKRGSDIIKYNIIKPDSALLFLPKGELV